MTVTSQRHSVLLDNVFALIEKKVDAQQKSLVQQFGRLLYKNISSDDIYQIKLQKFARFEAKQVLSTQLDRKKFLYSIMNDKQVKGLLKEGKYKIAQVQVRKILREWS